MLYAAVHLVLHGQNLQKHWEFVADVMADAIKRRGFVADVWQTLWQTSSILG